MKYIIDTDILAKNNLSLSEFGMLLFYAGGKITSDIETINKSLWEKGYLIKDLTGFYMDHHKFEDIQNILSECSLPVDDNLRADNLAPILRDIFPKGFKVVGIGSKYSWRDCNRVIAGKLKTFFKRYGTQYTDAQIIEATRKYVESFNGNYTYMKLLKYFIWKDTVKEDTNGKGYVDENSDLVNLLETEDVGSVTSNWINELK